MITGALDKWQLALNNAVNYELQQLSLSTGRVLAKPTHVGIIPTMRCNFRCQQCDIWRSDERPSELTTAQWKKVLLDLRQWLGAYRVAISGGEPLLRPDIVELLEFCRDNRIYASIVTNGWLVNHERAAKLIAARPLNINLSLDGGTPETHDTLRGIPGAFERATGAAHLLNEQRKAQGVTTGIFIKTTIMRQNVRELETVLDWVDREQLSGLILQPIQENLGGEQYNRKWFEDNPLWPDYATVCAVLDNLVERKRGGSRLTQDEVYFRDMKEYFKDPSAQRLGPCQVGVRNLGITSDGKIEFCYHVMPSFGNVVETHARELWSGDRAREARRRIKACDKMCMATCYAKAGLKQKLEMLKALSR
ncbi:MAG: radical SAM protein [Chloroflexota bacterium]|nr:MAG: radical SAM protein [Chloroflexota bacterium]